MMAGKNQAALVPCAQTIVIFPFNLMPYSINTLIQCSGNRYSAAMQQFNTVELLVVGLVTNKN